MKIKIGYPDKWETAIDNAEIKSTTNGGSYFTNMLSVCAANNEAIIALQGTAVDKTKWIIYPFIVNASYEQNLGGIGYIVAHEITHAFDNNGAKFDENGNTANWWAEEYYAAFNALCEDMIAFYDGEEGVLGIPMNGALTLSENVADNGAAACITEIVAGLEKSRL